MTAHKEFGDRLAQERREKAARERRDVLQKDVAKAVKTTAATVSRWEQGLVKPGDKMMEALAKFFGVTPSWLRYGQEPRVASAPPRGKLIPRPETTDAAASDVATGTRRR